jgi:uncharacterized protein (UPF0333 family)
MAKSRATILKLLREQKSFAYKFLAVGVVLIAVGVPFFLKARQFNATALHASGKILQLERQATGKDVSFFPVFSFKDQAGAEHVIHSRVGSSHFNYDVGDTVEVLYPANDPEQAKLNSFFALWVWPILFGGVGLIISIVGFLLWYWAATCPVDDIASGRIPS